MLALTILFVPIRYRIMGQAKDKDKISLNIRGSWIFHIVSVRVQLINKEFSYKIRIFGVPLNLEKKIKQKKPKSKKNKKTIEKPTENLETVTEPLQADQIPKISEEQEKTEVKQQIPDGNREENRFFSKVKGIFAKIKAFPGMIRKKLETIKNKIRNFREKFNEIWNEVQDENNRQAVKSLFGELKYLLKHISPRKVKGEVAFGMEDPATTGKIIGAVSALPFLYCYDVNIMPDFNTDNTYATETGMGLASSFANATAILEKTYGRDLVAIKHLELYEPADIIILNEDVVNQYSKENFGLRPCDHEGNVINLNREGITNER